MIRRRLLLSMLNQFKWLPYSYEYLYYSLVPQTIDGMQVKNKARANTIYGNSVVENNYATITRTSTTMAGLTYTNNGNDTFDLSGTATRDDSYGLNDNISIPNGHIVLLQSFQGSSSTGVYMGLGGNVDTTGNGIIFTQNNQTRLFLYIKNGAVVNLQNRSVKLIDLTQMFPFDTPTAITDNRVQAILNRNIPCNNGEIKSVDISEISSEPYNLFDGEFEIGGTYNNGAIDLNYKKGIVSQDYINVIPSFTYSFEVAVYTDYSKYCVCEYDENKTFIQRTFKYKTSSNEFTLTNQTKYVRLAVYDNPNDMTELPSVQFAFHRTGTRTGYALHTSPQTLSFKYQGGGVGTSHDKMEITSSEVVFTKNVFKITLTGNETITNLTQFGTNFMGIDNLFDSSVKPPDSSLPMFNKRPFNLGNINKLPDGYCYTYSRNFYYNIGTNDLQANKDFITGLEIQYPLATPQVVRIPRKKFGIVDLGSLTYYATNASNGHFGSIDLQGIVKNNTTKLYCSKFINGNPYVTNECVFIEGNGTLDIKSSSFIGYTTTQVKQALSNIYLFYETQDEVADILTQIGVESGGTLTTDSDVLPNAIFDFKAK